MKKLPDGLGHEVCNQTIEELLKVVASQRELLESTMQSLNAANETIATLNSLMALIPAASTAKRRRGAPKKRAGDSHLVEIFNNTMKPKFSAAHPRKKVTDIAVLTWFFVQHSGMSASRVRGSEFQGKLKTFLNRLGDARNRYYQVPIK